MYYRPTSRVLLFFLFSLIHYIPCTSSKKELGWCEALFQCGNLTAGFPFSGESRPKVCGHPLLKLHCNNNITSLFISDQEFYVLSINQTSISLTLARPDHLGPFCSSTFTDTSLPPEIFELSPTYKSINVFYLCNTKVPNDSNYSCPDIGHVSLDQTLEYRKSCHARFAINVPKRYVPEEKELDLTQLESVLREGFEVKVNIDEKSCRKCLSYHTFCGFDENFPLEVKCRSLLPPDSDDLRKLCGKRFSCGDQHDLYYPFWISGREECGHPDLKLECNSSFAELTISSVKFRILEANYTSRITRLARSDYINNNLCPRNPLNARFDENITPFSPDTGMLTIYYNCHHGDRAHAVSTYVGELTCWFDNDGRSYYVTRNLSSPLVQDNLHNLKMFCGGNVSIPVTGLALDKLQNAKTRDNVKKAIEEGFEVEINQDCSMCLDSGGTCGYNQFSSSFACYCEGWVENKICAPRLLGLSYDEIKGLGIVLGGIIISFLIVKILACFISYQGNTSNYLRHDNLKALVPLQHYSYAQVKTITNSFSQVIGRGGFGTVYRGTLCDGRGVAVKVLKISKTNDEDFINEVATMSKTSHVNIVDLLGFCSEGSNRAIFYEFLENGSLDRFISRNCSTNLDLTTVYNIALGIARGLDYLHHGCKARIVHFDIKPQNVLLDDNLCPKISDFGLAKLCEKKGSVLSLMETRGTIGYIAPEVFSRAFGRVSYKSDVYSYGMLVLEMIGARKKERFETNSASSMYFPEWIYKDLEKEDVEDGISSEEDEISKKMALVGLWCIQSIPSNRPPMNRVVEMMEGSIGCLEVPPRPALQQIPREPFSESIWISEESSSDTEVLIFSKNLNLQLSRLGIENQK